MKKFGARIVATKEFKAGTDPRDRDKNNPALLTAGTRDYDALFIADDAFDFARQVPYQTVRPRPVVGAIDLEPVAWHWTWEHNGAPQVNGRFQRLTGGRHMESADFAAWIAVKMVVQATLRTRSADFAKQREFHFHHRHDLRRRQGPRVEHPALGPPVAPGGAARGALSGGGERAGGRLLPQDQRARHARRRRAGDTLQAQQVGAMQLVHVSRAMRAVTMREIVKFVQQRGRLLSALVRPLMWLAVFAAGFYNVFGVSIIPPYKTYITYQVYIVPGLLGIILLFHGMQSSLSMVYDREMGVMRLLLTAPLPRWVLLACKLVAGTSLSVITCYVFLLVCIPFDVTFEPSGWLYVLPALIVSGLMLGALWLFLSVYIRQVENFAGAMNFVMFPMFFFSSALYPLWKLQRGRLGGDLLGVARQPVHALRRD